MPILTSPEVKFQCNLSVSSNAEVVVHHVNWDVRNAVFGIRTAPRNILVGPDADLEWNGGLWYGDWVWVGG